MTLKCFADHMGIEVDTFSDTLLQLMGNVKEYIEERAQHNLKYDDKVKACRVQSCDGIVDSGKALDVGSAVSKCKGSETAKLDTTSSSTTLVTHDTDADFRPINEQELCAEVPLTYQHNGLSKERHHTDHMKPSYDSNFLEKTDSNAISNSTNMSHKGGENDQDAEHDDESSSLFMAESFKSNDMVDIEVFNELSNRFLQLEKHCISLEIAMQQKEENFQTNQPCKNPELPDFREFFMINDLKAQLETKNLTINKLKKRIFEMCDMCNEVKDNQVSESFATRNFELEQNVAELLKENESLKRHQKDLCDSIKVTKTKTVEQTTSLIAKNDELKDQLQEKGFAIVALRNDLRKLTGNSVNTKFAKPSILGKTFTTS